MRMSKILITAVVATSAYYLAQRYLVRWSRSAHSDSTGENKPVITVYSPLTQFEEFPQPMENSPDINQENEERLFWGAEDRRH